MAIPMCLNLGLSGVAMAGADVGGFAFDANGELLVRWTQAGAFFPFFRNHSEIKSVRQEPWAFGEEIEKIVTRYIELRYRWLPHFYNLQRECALTGMPLMRPLVLEYPDDANTYNLNDQFLIGDSVLIAPVMQPDMERRLVYLPAGDWVDYWTNEHLRGGRCYIATAPLDTLPIYIKSGAVIFQSPVRQSTKEAMQELAMYVYFAEKVQTATYRFYDDDGETINHKNGEYYEESGSVSLAAGSLEIRITIEHDGYTPEWKRKRLLYVQGVSERLPVVLNGQPVPEEQIHFAADKRMLSISLADGK